MAHFIFYILDSTFYILRVLCVLRGFIFATEIENTSTQYKTARSKAHFIFYILYSTFYILSTTRGFRIAYPSS